MSVLHNSLKHFYLFSFSCQLEVSCTSFLLYQFLFTLFIFLGFQKKVSKFKRMPSKLKKERAHCPETAVFTIVCLKLWIAVIKSVLHLLGQNYCLQANTVTQTVTVTSWLCPHLFTRLDFSCWSIKVPNKQSWPPSFCKPPAAVFIC